MEAPPISRLWSVLAAIYGGGTTEGARCVWHVRGDLWRAQQNLVDETQTVENVASERLPSGTQVTIIRIGEGPGDSAYVVTT